LKCKNRSDDSRSAPLTFILRAVHSQSNKTVTWLARQKTAFTGLHCSQWSAFLASAAAHLPVGNPSLLHGLQQQQLLINCQRVPY
jgi:hypothetical protein